MQFIINIISMISASIFGVGVIYLVLDATIGKIYFLKSKSEWYGLQIKDFVFLLISSFVLFYFFDIKLPN